MNLNQNQTLFGLPPIVTNNNKYIKPQSECFSEENIRLKIGRAHV